MSKKTLIQTPKELFNKRTILLDGSITQELVDRVTEELFDLQLISNEPINLLLDSKGGELQPALVLSDVMTYIIESQINGIVTGFCGSAATFIFLSCIKRSSLPHSRFLIHSGVMNNLRFSIDDEMRYNMDQAICQAEEDDRRTFDFYLAKLKIKNDGLRKMIKRGDQRHNAWFSAKEALEIRFIHHIVNKNLNLFSK